MRQSLLIILILLVLGAAAWGGRYLWENYGGARFPLAPASSDISEELAGNTGTSTLDNGPLSLPSGFSISVFARNLPGARVMARDEFGNIWVSQTGEGQVSLIEVADKKASKHYPVLKNLKNPHGLAFDPSLSSALYFAEEHQISRVPVYSDGAPEKIIDLPSGGGHYTRTIGFGPDKRLYVSIGSSCNVCRESDSRRAKIFSMKSDGSDFKEFARGLRNAVFFIWDSRGVLWMTEMGRDLLGDDTPPDEINIAAAGNAVQRNFGWPICYGSNTHDGAFDKNTYIRNPCMEPFEIPSYIDIPAHSAPLGLQFVPDDAKWPEDYEGDLLVAYHGSWNRSTPTGYKVVRFSQEGGEWKSHDFITGWLTKSKEVIGRPVDLKFLPDGTLLISDDKAGVIYKVEYGK